MLQLILNKVTCVVAYEKLKETLTATHILFLGCLLTWGYGLYRPKEKLTVLYLLSIIISGDIILMGCTRPQSEKQLGHIISFNRNLIF